MTRTKLTEVPTDDFFPLLHHVSEESIIHDAAQQYLFSISQYEGSVFSPAGLTIHSMLYWWLFYSECRTLPPWLSLREGEAAVSALSLNGPDQTHQGLQSLPKLCYM